MNCDLTRSFLARMFLAVLLLPVLGILHIAQAQGSPSVRVDEQLYRQEKLRTNAGTVSILVSGRDCTCTQFAEDIRNVVNDIRPQGQRALIALGEGGPQNLKDAIYLLGVHMAIVDESNLSDVRTSDPVVYSDVENKIRYVTKLYNAEFHIVARKEITSLQDLAGKRINVELAGSQTDLNARRIFETLGIAYQPTHLDNTSAERQLLNGEIAAMVLSTGAPQESLLTLTKGDNVHLLPIDEQTAGDKLTELLASFLPAELTSAHYPNLIDEGKSVPTVASRVVLAIYNWPEDGERYRRNSQFINAFFSKIQKFRHPSRHPKWKEINLAAEVPGWKRFKPAQKWLDKNLQSSAVAARPSAALRPSDPQNDVRIPETQKELENLFQEFQVFLKQRGNQ